MPLLFGGHYTVGRQPYLSLPKVRHRESSQPSGSYTIFITSIDARASIPPKPKSSDVR